jgi:hypothetical protein
MFKKCYVAIVSNDEGKPVGSIMVSVKFYKNAHFAYDKVLNELKGRHNIVKFERIK